MKSAVFVRWFLRKVGIGFLIALFFCGPGWQMSRAELLYVNANRWIRTGTDLTVAGVSAGTATNQVLYGQNLWLVFSGLADAQWAELVMPDGTTNDLIPADPSLWHHSLPQAEAVFHIGAEIGSAAELNSISPSGASYLVRFGGGDLGPREGQIFIPSDTSYFSNPPQAQFSAPSMERFSSYDASMPVPLNAPGRFSLQTTNWIPLFTETMPYTVPADVLQPGLDYVAVSWVDGPSSTGTSFAGLTRSGTNAEIFLITLGAQHEVYFRTRPPHLRLTFQGSPAYSAVNQTTSMQVQLASNPNYDAFVEFAESLQGSPVWMQASASFATNGIASVVLQKGGDVRTNWSKQMFFRLRNQLTPVTAQPNPPQATPF